MIEAAPSPRSLSRRVTATLLGLMLLCGVVAVGWTPLRSGILAGGWSLLWIVPLHLVSDTIDSIGWRSLLRFHPKRPNAAYFAWAASMRDAASALLPIIGAAAPLLGANLLTQRGIRGLPAFASVVVESSLSLVSQAFFVLSVSALGFSVTGNPLLLWLLVPPAIVTLALGLVFVVLQRNRKTYLRFSTAIGRVRFLSRFRRTLPLRLYAALQRIHRHPYRLLVCVAWQVLALLAGALELWVMLLLLHRPVTLLIPLLLQAAAKLSRSLSFAVPAGLGVQEGVFAGVAAASGLPVSIGLGLSLLSRCRDVLFGVPLLTTWWLRRTSARSTRTPRWSRSMDVERLSTVSDVSR